MPVNPALDVAPKHAVDVIFVLTSVAVPAVLKIVFAMQTVPEKQATPAEVIIALVAAPAPNNKVSVE
jgi:hypothetical protein